MIDWVEMTRRGGDVVRNHTYPTLLDQTVAQHSFNMACIVLTVTDGEASKELLKACLFHDLHEQYTGDVPAPVKWNNETLHASLYEIQEEFDAGFFIKCELTPQEESLLHFADSLEFQIYCCEELMLGNRNIVEMYTRSRNKMLKKASPFPTEECEFLFLMIHNNWEQMNDKIKK